jgi:hypothetical protein
MNQLQQRRLDALLRVQAFLDANATTVGAIGTSAARKELDDAVSALTDHSTAQGSLTRNIAGQKNIKRTLEISIRNEHMKPIATFARARLRGTPNYASLTRRVDRYEGNKLIHSARAMATAAAPYADSFSASGLPADTVEQLATAADELQNTITARASNRVARVSATRAVEEHLVAGKEAVSILHAIITKQFARDPVFLAAWDAARRVGLKLGPVRSIADDAAPVTAPPATNAAPAS